MVQAARSQSAWPATSAGEVSRSIRSSVCWTRSSPRSSRTTRAQRSGCGQRLTAKHVLIPSRYEVICSPAGCTRWRCAAPDRTTPRARARTHSPSGTGRTGGAAAALCAQSRASCSAELSGRTASHRRPAGSMLPHQGTRLPPPGRAGPGDAGAQRAGQAVGHTGDHRDSSRQAEPAGKRRPDLSCHCPGGLRNGVPARLAPRQPGAVQAESGGAGAGGADVHSDEHIATLLAGCTGGCRHRPESVADQLVALDLVLVQCDQRPVQRPGGLVTARVDDHRAAEAADAGGLVDVAVQSDQRLVRQLGLAHRAAADRDVLHLAEDCLHLEVGVELRRVIEMGGQRRGVQVEDGPLGMRELVGAAGDGRRQLGLGLLAVGVPRGGVRVAPADHLVVVINPDDLAFAMRAPGRAVQQLTEFLGVVVAQHEVERDAVRAQPLIGDREPGGEPFLHQAEEEVIQGPVRLHRLELARLGPVRVVAVVGDELLQRGKLRAILDGLLPADEPGGPAPAGLALDLLNGLACQIGAQDEHVRAVDRGSVDELAETPAGAVQVAHEVDRRLGHVALPPCCPLRYLAASMPRAGGDYVWVSRVLSPPLALISNVAMIFGGLFGAAFFANVLRRVRAQPGSCRAGVLFHNNSFVSWGSSFQANTTWILIASLAMVALQPPSDVRP